MSVTPPLTPRLRPRSDRDPRQQQRPRRRSLPALVRLHPRQHRRARGAVVRPQRPRPDADDPMPLGPRRPREGFSPESRQRLDRHQRAHRRADLTVKTPRRRPSPRVQDERGADERGRRDTRVRVAVVLEPPLLFASVSSGERGGGERQAAAPMASMREPRRAPTLALAGGRRDPSGPFDRRRICGGPRPPVVCRFVFGLRRVGRERADRRSAGGSPAGMPARARRRPWTYRPNRRAPRRPWTARDATLPAPPVARGARPGSASLSPFSPAPSSVPTTNVCSNANQVS